MPDQIYIGNFSKGLITSRLPFVIDNDSFPFLFNFYVWRGRAKRKRGTLFLGQLQYQVVSVLNSTPPARYQVGQITTLDGSGNGSANLISLYSLGSSSTIAPGTINLFDGTNTYTEPSPTNGTLVGSPAGTGTINYATGALTISGGVAGGVLRGVAPPTQSFGYFPGLPVMGLSDFAAYMPDGVYSQFAAQYPSLLAFDTKYSYQINEQGTPFFYVTSFYKSTNIPFVWSGQDYQQFWTTNFSGALWATNGKKGFHFKFLDNTLAAAQSVIRITATQVTIGITAHGLIVNDLIWINEVTGAIATGSGTTANQNINGQTGIVAVVVDANTITVNFTGNNGTTAANFLAGATGTDGIAQYLTNSIAGQDGIKWYDGDPTNGRGVIPAVPTGLGWVNFSPALTASTVSIDGTPKALYYLVGALAILPYRDRLLFFGPTIQASSGSPITLQDTVLWSWNGTPYYAQPVPINQTSNIAAYYVDQTGRGGYLPAGLSQPIITVGNNEDALLIGFGGDGRKTRFVYTGNDFQPFLFFNINSELPSQSTFSSIDLDKGMIDIGTYGIGLTSQQSSSRIDLDIPDQVFEIQSLQNGAQRVNAARDFFREWIYFCFPITTDAYVDRTVCRFPLNTFLLNYRDNTWAVLYENFTAHGTYRASKARTWLTIGYSSWDTWREPWNSGSSTAEFPTIIAGNPQGYVLKKGQGTGEAKSGTIQAIANDGFGNTQITSINHCVTANNPGTGTGDFLLILGASGLLSSTITAITLGTVTILTTVNTFSVGQFITVSGVTGTVELNNNSYEVLSASGTSVTIDVDSTLFTPYVSGGTATISFNGQIGQVMSTADANTFVVDIPFPLFNTPPGGYIGLATFTRLSQPFLQTKQFGSYWEQGRKVRLCAQKYLLDTTENGQVTVNIYLSQDNNNPWNDPDSDPPNNGLIYSQLMYTCPESTNLGLTPANTNLQMPTAQSQNQIWHRFNTSMLGDSVQIGITLNTQQMKNLSYATSEIALQAIHLTVEKSSHLA